MSKSKSIDVLTDPEIQRHTQRILELQKEERQAQEEMGRIVAGIGAELIAVKEALDKTPDKTAWQRWLKGHVHYTVKTAQNYMSVARFAGKNENVFVISGLDPAALYRLAALPDEKAATLTPDTLLTDPRTGRQTALSQMSARELDRALDALEGKSIPQNPKPASTGVALAGVTREDAAADAQRIMGLLADQLADIRKRKGSLTGASKQQVLEAIEHLRGIVLKWPAWATPATRKK
ncbi:MAG: hypothetical protein WCI20_10915 [bacterium]